MYKNTKSLELTQEFAKYYPGGHSNLRRGDMGAMPYRVFIDHAKGSHVWDVDGNEYIDFACSVGPSILGFCNDEYVESLYENMKRFPTIAGSSVFYGEDDIKVAELLSKYVPCGEQFKFTVTGSEAVHMAFRIARAYTGKGKIVRFVENYAGWFDNVLGGRIKVDSEGEYEIYDDPENDIEYSMGLSSFAKKDMLLLPWNDFDVLRKTFEKHHDEIAGIHFEPIGVNSFGLFPKPGFLELIRELCDKYNVVMSYDEIITGIRTGLGGAQKYFGVVPDICTMAKSVAGGMPISLIAGKKKIMAKTLSDRRVLGPGTFMGWNLGMHSIITTLEMVERNDCALHKNMVECQEILLDGIMKIVNKHKVDIRITEAPGVFGTMFGAKGGRQQIYSLDDLEGYDEEFTGKFRVMLQEEGVTNIPGIRWFMSLAHTKEDMEVTLKKFDLTLGKMLNK